jgi:protein-disulfide isomerase
MKNTPSIIIVSIAWLGFVSISLNAAEAQKETTPVAKAGNIVLTDEEMRKEVASEIYEAENKIYSVKKNWVDQKVKTLLMAQAAKEAKLSLEKWQKKEIDAKAASPTQAEIDQWAPRFGVRGSTGAPTDAQYADMKEKAKAYLIQQKRAQREMEVTQQLMLKNGPTEYHFEKPVAPVINLTISKHTPVKGPANAPVTIIEFTDFECPWCKRSQEQVKAVERAFPGQVRFVDRMFPLTMHARAMPAAEAAYCAKDQGKFWEMREKLFESQALADDDFKKYAKELGLNQSKFDTCMSSDKYVEIIQLDMAEGQRAGVRGTPTFFVNGVQANFQQLADTVKSALEKKN